MAETKRLVDQYTQQLDIMWKVNSGVGQVDRPSIVSDPQNRIHRVMFPPGPIARCDLAHELVHASWAEKIDPIFSTVYFDPSYDTQDPETAQRMHMVYYAQQLIDVWVSDRLAQLDKALPQEDVATFTDSMLRVPDQVYRQSPLEVILGSAMNQAQITRLGVQGFNNKQKQMERRIESVLGRDNARVTKKLTTLYEQLPPLPMDRAEAIPLFEQQTQKAAQILGFPINPQIQEIDQRAVWTM